MAYTLLVDRVDAYAVAAYTIAGISRAFGNDVDMPDPDRVRLEFDTALAAEPVRGDSDQQVLLSVLGLGG